MKAGQGDLRTIARGLIPAGFDAATLTPEGRDEVREAIDVILKLSDYRNAKLGLALEQLEKAAAEIERLRAALSDARDALRNDFEPDNQSNAYKRATRALAE